MSPIETILTAVGTGGVTAAVVGWLLQQILAERIKNSIRHEYNQKLENLKSDIRGSEIVRQARWEIKRQACLEALGLVDSHFAGIEWNGVKPEEQPKVEVARARLCYNSLALACDSERVLTEFKRCLGLLPDKNVRADMIVDLRNAIRSELGFGTEIDTDRTGSWIARLNVPKAM